MRTLLISDVHLGQTGGTSVLTRPRPLAALLEALDDHDQLVLLGDIIELQEAHPSHSFPVAEPVLRAVAERLGRDKRMLLVPGNHDHGLVRDWALAQGADLARENVVPADGGPLLSRVLSWMHATQTEVHYPGAWLADGTWITHGHYLNHYLRPISSWGLHARVPMRAATPEPPATFERNVEVPAAEHMRDGLPPERWLDRHIPTQLSPLTAYMLGRQMERHALPAMVRTVEALGVDAEWVIFGHVHRRGPRGRDKPARWSGSGGAPRLVNTGSWRYEPVVARGSGARGPYWPGGAVSIGEDGVPHSIGLLDRLTERELLSTGG